MEEINGLRLVFQMVGLKLLIRMMVKHGQVPQTQMCLEVHH